MNKKLVSNVLTGIILAGSIIIGDKAETQAETFRNVLQPIPESVLIEHLDKNDAPRAGALPSSADISTSKYFPAIQSQGGLGSCAAFATTYYQFSYEANKLNDVNSKDINNCYSPKWIYNSLNGGSLDGVQISNAYDFLEDYGSLRWRDFPYDTGWRSGTNEIAKEAYTDLPGKAYADKMREALSCRLVRWNSYAIQGTGTAITSNKDADLDVIKLLLVQGHPLVVQTDCDWEIKKSQTGEYVIVSGASNGRGHAMTVVGYNDNVWVDVNGNGSKDTGECGAFKVANSWGVNAGETNAGFVWVLYDALNGKSSISGYKRADGKARVPMFSLGTTNIYFMGIEVENKEVEFVAEVNFAADKLNQLQLTYGKSNKNANVANTQYRFGDYTLNQPSVYNGVVLIDMEQAMGSIVTDYKGYKWYLTVGDAANDTQLVRNISYKVTDNLGNTIKDGGTITSVNGNKRTLAAGIDLLIGDVDYSGAIDTDDALLVQRYAVGLERFSNLQLFLGDVNGDGFTDVEDAQLILSHSLGM